MRFGIFSERFERSIDPRKKWKKMNRMNDWFAQFIEPNKCLFIKSVIVDKIELPSPVVKELIDFVKDFFLRSLERGEIVPFALQLDIEIGSHGK